MTIFITGATGYLGSYVVHELLSIQDRPLTLLVRGRTHRDAEEKLWRALQLHMDVDAYRACLPRIDFVLGDVTAPTLGLGDDEYARLVRRTDSILHIAASLNRKSDKACLNTNLRGTLALIKLGRAVADHHGLARFSYVSTVAVAGQRSHEVVREDEAIDWNRSDYDPYGRTKKFGEHMVHELLPDVPRTIFRPAIVMGDSRFAATSQFDMVRAFCVLADLPIVPLDPAGRLDIVNADFVGPAIARLHVRERTLHDTYHLSSGRASLTAGEIAATMSAAVGRKPPTFVRALERPFARMVDGMNALPKGNPIAGVGALLKVFLPYITYDTVFDNERVTSELGIAPVPFTEYAAKLYRYAKDHDFAYPYLPLPSQIHQVVPSRGFANDEVHA